LDKSSKKRQAAQIIGKPAVLEFGLLSSDPNNPNIKWKNSLGAWIPATGVLNGKTVELTDTYIQQFSYVSKDPDGQIKLKFSWNSDGSILSGEIMQHLIGKPLGIFFR
jgi:hypothetical protein